MINKINPIYILALIFTVFLISINISSEKKEEFKKENKNYEKFSVKAKNYNSYKNTWFDRSWVIKRLDSIIKNSTFKKEKILKVENKNIIRIKIESKSQRILNKFLNKVLNERFILKNIDIEKDSITLEIGLN